MVDCVPWWCIPGVECELWRTSGGWDEERSEGLHPRGPIEHVRAGRRLRFAATISRASPARADRLRVQLWSERSAQTRGLPQRWRDAGAASLERLGSIATRTEASEHSRR